MLHRDIKPENVLLDHASNARLSDLGEALIVQNKGSLQQGEVYSRQYRGTPGYMAPEVLTCPQKMLNQFGRFSERLDEKLVEHAKKFHGAWDLDGYGVGADWWALGCLLWDLLAPEKERVRAYF